MWKGSRGRVRWILSGEDGGLFVPVILVQRACASSGGLDL